MNEALSRSALYELRDTITDPRVAIDQVAAAGSVLAMWAPDRLGGQESQEQCVDYLLAVDEYLDAVLRVAGRKSASCPVAEAIKAAARCARFLREASRPSGPVRLTVDTAMLAISVSLILLSEEAAVPEAERDRIQRAARRLILDASHHSSATPESKLWALRVAGDALDLCFHPHGRHLLKRVAKVSRQPVWSNRSIRRFGRYGEPGEAIDGTYLEHSLEEYVSRDVWRPQRLPQTSATDDSRYRSGRGQAATYWKRTHWNLWQLTIILVALVIPLAVLTFVYRLRQLQTSDPSGTIQLTTLSLDLNSQDILNITLQLLSTSVTLTVALAIGDKLSTDEQWVAAQRWRAVGSVVLILCGWTSMTSVALLVASHPRGPFYSASISFVVSLLTCALAVGVEGLQQERDLRVARQRRSAVLLRHLIDSADERGAVRLKASSTTTRAAATIVLWCTAPGFTVGCLLLFVLSGDGVSVQELTFPVSGLLVNILSAGPAAILSYSVVRARYDLPESRSRLILSVPLFAAITLLLNSLIAISAFEVSAGSPITARLILFIASVGVFFVPAAALLLTIATPRVRPYSLRRLAHLNAESSYSMLLREVQAH